MSEELVIGGETATEHEGEERAEALIGGPPEDADETADETGDDADESELARLLREALIAAHDDLAPEDLRGRSAAEVRERYLAARARLEREAAQAPDAPVPAGAPGRFAPAPATAFEKIREGLTRLNG